MKWFYGTLKNLLNISESDHLKVRLLQSWKGDSILSYVERHPPSSPVITLLSQVAILEAILEFLNVNFIQYMNLKTFFSKFY